MDVMFFPVVPEQVKPLMTVFPHAIPSSWSTQVEGVASVCKTAYVSSVFSHFPVSCAGVDWMSFYAQGSVTKDSIGIAHSGHSTSFAQHFDIAVMNSQKSFSAAVSAKIVEVV